jgi:hypothetical protein
LVWADTTEVGPLVDTFVTVPLVLVVVVSASSSTRWFPITLVGLVDEGLLVSSPGDEEFVVSTDVLSVPVPVSSARAIAPLLLQTRSPIESAQAPAAARKCVVSMILSVQQRSCR